MPLAQPQTTPVVNTQQPAAAAAADWRVGLLTAMGAPVTKQNLAFLGAWQKAEGGSTNNAARFNYMNLTTGALASHGLPSSFPTFTSSNGSKIVIFPDQPTGLRLTAAYIQGGQYPVIVAGLKKGNPLQAGLVQGVIGDLSTWVSGSRTANTGYGRNIVGSAALQAGPSAQASVGSIIKGVEGAAGAVAAPGAGVLFPVIGVGGVAAAGSGILDGVPGGNVVSGAVDAVTAGPRAIAWLFGNWDRALEVAAGGVLVVVGVILLGAQLGLTPGPKRLAALTGSKGLDAITPDVGPPAREGVRYSGKKSSFPGPAAREARTVRSSGYDPGTAEIPF